MHSYLSQVTYLSYLHVEQSFLPSSPFKYSLYIKVQFKAISSVKICMNSLLYHAMMPTKLCLQFYYSTLCPEL